MSEIVEPMVAMKMSLEEFVALKAFVSWKGSKHKSRRVENKYKLNEMIAVIFSLSS